jgi:hypothetical protein
MELLLYLAEFQDEQGQVADPLEVDRMLSGENAAPDTESPAAPDRQPASQTQAETQRPTEPDHDAP